MMKRLSKLAGELIYYTWIFLVTIFFINSIGEKNYKAAFYCIIFLIVPVSVRIYKTYLESKTIKNSKLNQLDILKEMDLLKIKMKRVLSEAPTQRPILVDF